MRQDLKKIRTVLIYILLGVGLGGLVFWGLRPSPLVVEIAAIKKGTYIQQVVDDARTRAHDVYVVTAIATGILQRVEWDEGDRIKKGDEVARIFPRVSNLLDLRTEQETQERVKALTASYERAKVLVERALVAYKTATSDYQRNSKLVERGYVSKSEFEHIELEMSLRKKEYESAQFNAEAAKYAMEQAKATLEQMQSNIIPSNEHFLRVLSPVDGQIIKVDQESEGPITAGAPILSVANVSDLEIVSDILSTDAVQVKPGDSVLIEHWGGDAPLKGQVRLVEPGGFMKLSALGVEEQRVNVIIDITSPREEWKNLGAEFRVDIAIEVFKADNVIMVPVSALFRYHDQWAVFVVQDNKAHLRYIDIGRRNPQSAIVTKGLKVGEKVILYPGERVADGVRVRKES